MIAFRKQFKDKAKEKPANVSTNENQLEPLNITMEIKEEPAEPKKAGQQWSAELIK